MEVQSDETCNFEMEILFGGRPSHASMFPVSIAAADFGIMAGGAATAWIDLRWQDPKDCGTNATRETSTPSTGQTLNQGRFGQQFPVPVKLNGGWAEVSQSKKSGKKHNGASIWVGSKIARAWPCLRRHLSSQDESGHIDH